MPIEPPGSRPAYPPGPTPFPPGPAASVANYPPHEAATLRRMLQYALIHADAATRQVHRTFAVLADDPTIGPDHPAYFEIARTRPTGWNPRQPLIEAAIGRPLEPGESFADAIESIKRKVRDGEFT